MTTFQLSRFLDISEDELEMIEEGEMSLTTVQLDKLCDIFRCTEDHVLGFDKGYIEPIDYKDHNEEAMAAIGTVLKIARNLRNLEDVLHKKGETIAQR